MNHSAMKLSLVFLMTSGFSAAPERVATDGAVRPDETNVAYQFRCGERLATLRYTQTEHPGGAPGAELERAVSLSELSVSGRNIAPASLVAAAELFRTFAWVQTVTARCYEGAVDISVRAMAAAEWSASLRNDLPRPSERTRQLRIGPDGSVSIP